MKKLQLEGKRRGRLKFIKIAYIKNQSTYWECLCDCGNVCEILGAGKTKSCGCLSTEAKSINGLKNKNTQTPIEFIKTRIIIDPKTKCWNWQKSLIKGYARVSGNKGKKSPLVSRYVYEYIKGINPKNKLVCHTCDNPKCVNPDHLFLGTHKDNFKDMREKNRSACGIKNVKAKLTEKEVLQIRKLQNKITIKEMTKIYNVTKTTISRILRRKTWKHI